MAQFIMPIISGLAGLFGGGAKKQTDTSQQSQQQSSQSGQFDNSGSTNPVLSQLQDTLSKLFTGQAENFAQTAPNLSGYTAQGLQDINSGGDIIKKNVQNTLASRGLSYSPYSAFALEQPDINRVNQQSQFLNSIPLLQRQLQQQSIGTLEGAFGAQPFGSSTSSSGTSSGTSSTTGSSTGTQTQSTPGGPLAGLFAGLGAGLGGLGGGGLSNLFGGPTVSDSLNNLPLLQSGLGGPLNIPQY